MQHISLYFDKYKKIERDAIGQKDMICKAIYEVTGIVLSEEKVSIHSDQARVKVTPGERSVMLERKDELLEKLSKYLEQKVNKVN